VETRSHGVAVDRAKATLMTSRVQCSPETEGQMTSVLFCCTGVGLFNRGIETFFREAFDGLQSMPGCQTRLLKGAGDETPIEKVMPALPRTGRVGPILGRLSGRSAYAVEQWTSFPFVIQEIRRFRPQVIFTSEANLLFLLRRFRRLIGAI